MDEHPCPIYGTLAKFLLTISTNKQTIQKVLTIRKAIFKLHLFPFFTGQKSSKILIIGNCDGKMYFFEIIEEEGKQSSAIKVDELKLNASFLNSKKTQDNQEQENADTGEIFFIVVHLPMHMWLGGCPNPSKMEQCWECTFLNLYAHVKTK